MHHLKQQWWQLEINKFRASCSRFEIPLRCLLLNDANSIATFDQNLQTPCYKLIWLMQFIVNNNQKYFTAVSYRMELLSYPHSTIRIHVPTLCTSLEIDIRPNISNKLSPTCGVPLRKMNTTDDQDISYLKINNTTNVVFKMYKVEGACLLFQFEKKKLERINPGLYSKYQISTGSWNHVWNRYVNIYIHVFSMALIMFTPNTPLLYDIPSPTKHYDFCCI